MGARGLNLGPHAYGAHLATFPVLAVLSLSAQAAAMGRIELGVSHVGDAQQNGANAGRQGTGSALTSS